MIAPPPNKILNFAKLLTKLVVPVKVSMLLDDMKIAPPPWKAKLLMKLLVPIKLSTLLDDVQIAPPF